MTVRNKLLITTVSAALAVGGFVAEPAAAEDQAPARSVGRRIPISSPPQQAAPAVQAKAELAAGAQVRDTNGGEVGTITKVDAQFVILKTDKHEVRLPVASFTAHQDHFLMAMTRDQLNAEVDKTKAAAAANLAAGATVVGSQGATVGTIEAIDAEFVTLKLTSGKVVRLPRNGVAATATGGMIGMTAADLEAAAAATGS